MDIRLQRDSRLAGTGQLLLKIGAEPLLYHVFAASPWSPFARPCPLTFRTFTRHRALTMWPQFALKHLYRDLRLFKRACSDRKRNWMSTSGTSDLDTAGSSRGGATKKLAIV